MMGYESFIYNCFYWLQTTDVVPFYLLCANEFVSTTPYALT